MKKLNSNRERTLITIIILILLTVGCSQEEATPVSFFYMELCPGCETYQKAEYLSGLVVTLGKTKTYEGNRFNMGHGDGEGNKVLFDTLEKFDLPDISYSLPLLFVGSEYFVGYEEIEEKLIELLSENKK